MANKRGNSVFAVRYWPDILTALTTTKKHDEKIRLCFRVFFLWEIRAEQINEHVAEYGMIFLQQKTTTL